MQTFDKGINKEEKSHHPQQKCLSRGRQALRNGQRTSCPFSSQTDLQKENNVRGCVAKELYNETICFLHGKTATHTFGND